MKCGYIGEFGLFISGWNMTFSIHKQKWVEACSRKVGESYSLVLKHSLVLRMCERLHNNHVFRMIKIALFHTHTHAKVYCHSSIGAQRRPHL